MAQPTAVEDINHIFRARYSGRAYDPAQEVSTHDLNAVFEAASPSNPMTSDASAGGFAMWMLNNKALKLRRLRQLEQKRGKHMDRDQITPAMKSEQTHGLFIQVKQNTTTRSCRTFG